MRDVKNLKKLSEKACIFARNLLKYYSLPMLM